MRLKILFALITSLIFSVLIINNVLAKEPFFVDLSNSYEFNIDGSGFVTDSFSIENAVTEKYLPSFIYKINNINVENVKVYKGQDELKYTVEKDNNLTLIKVNFENAALGKGEKTNFNVSYKINNLAIRTGDIWEISVPGIENINDYRKINTKLFVPKEFGKEAYISPKYISKNEDEKYLLYEFQKDDIEGSRIVAGFGEYQIFSFSIDYVLKNDSLNKSTKTIVIPPDTSYQRLYYKEINPRPENISVDDDGNWIAFYKLPPRSEINITVQGSVQIFATPRKYLVPQVKDLYENIKEQHYWQTSNENIISLSRKLETPFNMYEYVSKNLKYDTTLQSKQRLGAVKSLTSSENVTCREYTDLLITLIRASGIPAREIVGYAYTENPSTKPLTFFNDVLHSWVEYWDNEKGIWVSIDPTWGSTSNVDYFNKFDLRHFAFTIHGKSDTYPEPPGFSKDSNSSSKDIYVNFGSLESFNEYPVNVEISENPLFAFNRNISINLVNKNPIALYDKNVKYVFDGKLVSEENIKVLPPYTKINKNIKINYSFLGRNTATKINVLVNGFSFESEGFKKTDTYTQLLVIFLFMLIVVIFIFIKKILRKNATDYEKQIVK